MNLLLMEDNSGVAHADTIHLPHLIEFDQQQHLRRWQSQAIEESSIENVINHALEIYRIVNEAVNFENSAIQMAINSHGLRGHNSNIPTRSGRLALNMNRVDPISVTTAAATAIGSNRLITQQENSLRNATTRTRLSIPTPLMMTSPPNDVNISNIHNIIDSDSNNFIDQAIDVAIQREGLGLLNDDNDLDI